MVEKSDFIMELDSIERKLKFASSRAKMLRLAYEGRNEAFYGETLKFQTTLERAALSARNLPYFTGNPKARADVKKGMLESIPHEIGFTKEGWFSVKMPMLLPKKNSGSADYIREFLYPAMMRFFKGKERVRYRKCVVVYRHVYGENYPDQGKRDHDNIEVNQVTDILAMFVMPDDNPNVCNHYYMSAVGTENRTEVYVVPQEEFFGWLTAEKDMPKEGVKLYETKQ